MNELTKKAATWFDDIETWKSFVELTPLKPEIEEVWLVAATEKLRQHFVHLVCPGWGFREWDGPRDTWWFLEEFGAGSVGLGFGWRYDLFLGAAYEFASQVNRDHLRQALRRETYRPLVEAFGRLDQPREGFALVQSGDFSFGSPFDRHLPHHELAWYAGNQTDEFVKQAAAKIESFARNAEVTALLRRLNQELLPTTL